MARGGAATDKMFELIMIGGVAYVGYKVALSGSAGGTLQGIARSIQCILNPTGCQNPLAPVLPPGGTPTPTPKPSPVPGGRCTGGGNWGWMVASDPNIQQHIDEWQAAVGPSRKYDWAAFAAHEQAITGGFHPGSQPPDYFCR